MPIQPTTIAPAPQEFVNYLQRALVYGQITEKDFNPSGVGQPGTGPVSFPVFADRSTLENMTRAVQFGQITAAQISNPTTLNAGFGGPAPSDFVDALRGPLVSGQVTSSDFNLFFDSWDAYGDFYLSPTAAGWGGATSPSTSGVAWGYYAANINGFGFPTQIGSYINPTGGGLYQYSDVNPLGSGVSVGTSSWASTGGAGFPYYSDNQGWASSLGRYDSPWFAGAPGLSQGLTNLIWFQAGWLGSAAEGIAPVLTWKAPATGSYGFNGLCVSGNQPANQATVAVVDSLGTVLLPRTILANNTSNTFSFTKKYNAGDIIQFQVGTGSATGNAVGLRTNIQRLSGVVL